MTVYAKGFNLPKIIRTFYDDAGRRYDVYEADNYITAFRFRVIVEDNYGKLHAIYVHNSDQQNDNAIIREFKIWVLGEGIK